MLFIVIIKIPVCGYDNCYCNGKATNKHNTFHSTSYTQKITQPKLIGWVIKLVTNHI